ncbi:MAG: hypothetical protein O3A00_08280 [Planctomycetota bacterium]|nr:hypothetical protein [Planctomycetota bacterium]
MVNIFAREITDELASLVKQIDDVVGKNKNSKMAAFVVLLSDDPDADEGKLKALAEKHGIKNTPLTTFDGAAGPPNYKISEDAAVTVMLWQGGGKNVKANHAFGKGELNAKKIEAIVKDTSKILK